MRLIGLAVVLAACRTLAPLAAEAQQTGKVYRIGFVWPGAPGIGPAREAFVLRLRELGWIEGQNVVIEWRFAEGNFERLPALVADLLRLNVDVIVTVDTPAAKVAKEATKSVPIVIQVSDPVRTGLISSLARPGGNITGLDVANTELRTKGLQLLREVVPKASHIGFLGRPDNPALVNSWQELEAAAPSLGVKLRLFDVRKPTDIDGAFALMAQERVGGLLVPGDVTFASQRPKILDHAAKSRVPVLDTNRYWVEAGGLMSYGNDPRAVFRLQATYVDRILKGAKPADLPVERPGKIEFVINVRTAKTLGLTIPPPVLALADQVIQ